MVLPGMLLHSGDFYTIVIPCSTLMKFSSLISPVGIEVSAKHVKQIIVFLSLLSSTLLCVVFLGVVVPT